MIAALAPVASTFVATTVPHARARTAEELAARFASTPASVPVIAVADARGGRRRARCEQSPRAVAAGSIYMVGPLRARLIAAWRRHRAVSRPRRLR